MKWIKIQIPKRDEWVLVTDGSFMTVAQLRNGQWEDIHCYSIADVTHWAPLPEQPERSKREDLSDEIKSDLKMRCSEHCGNTVRDK